MAVACGNQGLALVGVGIFCWIWTKSVDAMYRCTESHSASSVVALGFDWKPLKWNGSSDLSNTFSVPAGWH
jgi:hypothetical protein